MKQKIWNKVASVALSTLVGTTAALLSSPSQGQTSHVNTQSTSEVVSQATTYSDLPPNSNPNPNQSDKNSTGGLPLKPEKVEATPTQAKQQAKSQKKGVASWYGGSFAGRRTANGETFNPGGLTAAHRTLPFGTRVKVTNLRNGRSVVVRINDRGPHSGGRVIDLSAGAARIIGVLQSGLAPVLIEVLGR
jgi:rare lipoprotein A